MAGGGRWMRDRSYTVVTTLPKETCMLSGRGAKRTMRPHIHWAVSVGMNSGFQ